MGEPVTIKTENPSTVEVLSFGGQCPVQGFGTVTGPDGITNHWYFRARGDAWSLSVGTPDEEIEHYVCDWTAPLSVWGDYGSAYDAGYMPDADAFERIGQALDLWLSGARGAVDVADD